MEKTIHGWPVIKDQSNAQMKLFTIPGTTRKIRLRKNVGPYLVAFASYYHINIAPIDEGTFDDWGWAPIRTGNASDKISDHCGGVAIDLNATREGSQSSSSLKFWRNPIKSRRLKSLRKQFSLLEWGGDYSSKNRDPMHFTFNYGVDAADVISEMNRMGIDRDGVIK